MSLKNFMRNIGTLARASWTAEFPPQSLVSGSFQTSGGISALLNVPGVLQPAQNVVMVYGCLAARRGAIGGVPLRITDGQDNVIESGPIPDLLARPNQTEPWDQYIRKLETYSTLYDAVFIAKVGTGVLPDELIPLSPSAIWPTIGMHRLTGTPIAVEWNYSDPTTGAQKIYMPEELIIHQGFNPDAPLAALSPLTALKRTMQLDNASRESNLALHLNSATPPLVLQSDQQITKEQADQILELWMDRNAGLRNKQKPAVLWGGLKAEKLGLSPAEMEYLEGLKFLRTDYYIVFRVKPAMVGEMTGETGLSQGSATDQQKVEWWEDVGLSELDMLAGLHEQLLRPALTQRLALHRLRRMNVRDAAARGRAIIRAERRALGAGAGTAFVFFDDNSIPALARQRLTKSEQLVKLCGLGWKPDDIAEYLDLGLPEHPDNLGRVAFSMATIGDGAPEPAPRSLVVPAGSEKPADQEESAPEKILTRIEALCRADGAQRAKDRLKKFAGLRRAFDAYLAPREKAAARRWSRFFLEQRERVLARVTQLPAGKLQRAEPKPTERVSQELLAKIFPMDEENRQLVARLSPLWAEHLSDGAKFFAQETGAKNPFAIETSPHLKAAIEKRTIQGLKVNATTEDALRGILRDSFEAGYSSSELADAIAGYYKANCVGEDSVRSLTAAHTQTTGILNEGRDLAAKEVGGLKKGWLHGGSKEPRESHLAAQARYMEHPIGLDEQFEVGDVECDFPGDSSLPPEEACNCTCTQIYVPAEDR